MRQHIALCHGIFPCDSCNFTAENNDDLKMHLKTLGVGGRYTYRPNCDICEEPFTSNNSLIDLKVSEHPESSDMIHLVLWTQISYFILFKFQKNGCGYNHSSSYRNFG